MGDMLLYVDRELLDTLWHTLLRANCNERSSNLNWVDCHSAKWRFEWLLSPLYIRVCSSWPESRFCVLETML